MKRTIRVLGHCPDSADHVWQDVRVEQDAPRPRQPVAYCINPTTGFPFFNDDGSCSGVDASGKMFNQR